MNIPKFCNILKFCLTVSTVLRKHFVLKAELEMKKNSFSLGLKQEQSEETNANCQLLTCIHAFTQNIPLGFLKNKNKKNHYYLFMIRKLIFPV